MKTNSLFLSAALAAALIPAAAASPRASASYALVTEASGESGGRSTGSGIQLDSTTGTGGLLAAGSGTAVAKTGYAGQLYEVTGVTIGASPATVDEGATRQLTASSSLDDDTVLALSPTDLAWSVVSGPVSGIDAAGLATAATVYADTAAIVQGSKDGIDGQFALTVLNVNSDDYQEYGGDGIDDDWQVIHFGVPPNPLAAPGENPDQDPHDNFFEFMTGSDPTNGSDFFQFAIDDRKDGIATFTLNKVIPDRTYHLKSSTDLGSFDVTVDTLTPVAEAADFEMQDPAADADSKFYIIEITKP